MMRRTRSRACIVAFGAVVLLGCGTVHRYRFPIAAVTEQVPVARPQIFFEGQLPAGQGLQELALVEAIGSGTKANVEAVVEAMAEEAARYGASAVVRVRVDCGYSQCHGWGVAVRYVRAQ